MGLRNDPVIRLGRRSDCTMAMRPSMDFRMSI
jgi:hypothetical protein